MPAKVADNGQTQGGSDGAAKAALAAEWQAAEKAADAAAKANPAFVAAMKALGVDESASDEPEPPKPTAPKAPADEPAETPKPGTEKVAEVETDDEDDDKDRATGVDTPEAKQKQLQALAKELGLRVVGQQVVLQERADFREEKRQFREQREKFVEQYKSAVAKVEPLAKARELYDQGDLEGALKLAWGKTLTEINEDAVAQASGVDLKTRREIQRLREEREQERREKLELQTQQRQREQQDRERSYVTELQTKLAAEQDTHIAELAKAVPQFAHDVFALQRHHYDADDGTTIPLEEAAKHVLAQYRQGWESLSKVFGAPGSPKNPESGSRPPSQVEQPRNGKPSSRTAATQQSRRLAGKRDAPRSDEEFFRQGTAALQEAMRDDPIFRH